MSEQTIVGRRHTIVVPKSIRKLVPLKEGQDVLLRAEGDKIVIEPLPNDPYETLKQVIGQPYEEERDERRTEQWVRRRAGH